jgi:hypothetical protein
MHFFNVEPYVQMIPNGSENLHDTQNATYPKHVLFEISIGHVLLGVNPCGRCIVVALLPHANPPWRTRAYEL